MFNPETQPHIEWSERHLAGYTDELPDLFLFWATIESTEFMEMCYYAHDKLLNRNTLQEIKYYIEAIKTTWEIEHHKRQNHPIYKKIPKQKIFVINKSIQIKVNLLILYGFVVESIKGWFKKPCCH